MLTFVTVHKWLVLQTNPGRTNQISNGHPHYGDKEKETGTFIQRVKFP